MSYRPASAEAHLDVEHIPLACLFGTLGVSKAQQLELHCHGHTLPRLESEAGWLDMVPVCAASSYGAVHCRLGLVGQLHSLCICLHRACLAYLLDFRVQIVLGSLYGCSATERHLAVQPDRVRLPLEELLDWVTVS